MVIHQNEKAQIVIINAIAYIVENPENVTTFDIQWAKSWIASMAQRKGLDDIHDYPELQRFMFIY